MHDLLADIRYGWRVLLRNPGFAATAIAALALGIGANTATFSAVDAVLLRPLPYPEADRLMVVWEDASYVSFPRNTPAPGNYFDWKKQNTVFSDMAASRNVTVNLTGDGAPETVFGRGVTPNFFSVLGVQPLMGRVFTVEEDRAPSKVAVLTHALWQRRYADREVIGRTIQINGEPWTVVGVMPPGFSFPDRMVQIYTPASLEAQATVRHNHFLNVVARLKPGMSVRQAQAEMHTIARRLELAYPATNTKVGAVVVPLREQISENARTGLLVLLSAAACVLLIACSNLANLLLAKATGRQREIAVRAALGAARTRIVRQMLTESAVLAFFGGVLGVVLGFAGTRLLTTLVPPGLPASSLAVDGRVLLFSLVVSAATALLFGLLPAWKGARVDLNDSLKQGSRGGIGGRRSWLRDGLVIAEIALALVLLVGAGLMMQTLYNMRLADTGFRSDHLLTLRVQLPAAKYGDAQKRMTFYDAVLDRIRALPGVESAAFAGNLPFTAIGNTTGYQIEGRPEPGPGNAQDMHYRPVTRDYFATLRARLKEGRAYTSEDRASSAPVLVINEHMARLHWGTQSPLGSKVRFGGQSVGYTVIGVVKDLRERGLTLETKPSGYMLMEQGNAGPGAFLAVRTQTDPVALAKAVSNAIWSVDKDQPVSLVRTMHEVIGSQMENRTIQMSLLTIFAVLALALASLGIYGVLSYLVTQRVREIGLRMALGASTGQIARMFLGRGLALTGIGLIIGAGASSVVSGTMRTMLYGVAPLDVRTYVAVACVLTAIALIACYIPAHRAVRIDPMIALRDE